MENNIVDGHLYGLPVQTDVTGLWYRRDWFDAEGLEPPASWEELLAVVDHFTRAEVQERLGYDYAIAFPVGARVGEATSNVLFTFFWSSAAELGVRGRGPLRLSPEAIEHTLRFLTQITHARRGCLPPDMDALYWWDFSRLLAQGRVPLIFGGTYEWPRIQEEFAWTEAEEVVEHLGLVPLPRPSRAVEPQVSLGGTSWAVLQQSPVAEVSLELLKIASSTEMSRTFCTEYLQISPYREVNRLFSDEDHPWLSAVVPLLALARPRPKLPNYAQVSLFLQDMIQQVLWEGAPLDETVRHTMQSLALLT
jgi:multiple sugar transport system substrate-binding protein